MNKTWKSLTAGVLSIAGGGIAVILGCGLLISLRVAGFLTIVPRWLEAALTIPSYPLIILGLFAILGGIFALVRKAWGLALAGSIAALVVSPVLGLAAIIFIIIARKEFSVCSRQAPVSST